MKGDWLINAFDTCLFVCDVHDPAVGLIREEYEGQFLSPEGGYRLLKEDESVPPQHWEGILGVARGRAPRGERSLPQLVVREHEVFGNQSRETHVFVEWDTRTGELVPRKNP